jgi:uncharacterized protein YidB (DUF937 family)
MGLLDQAQQGIGQLAGQFGGNNKLIGAAARLITSSDIGGLQGLLQKFQQSGYGDAVQSWISGDGEKKSLSGEDVQKVLGKDKVRQVADQAGMNEQEASGGLASAIPQLVDKMTPDGQVPDNQSANGSLSQLAGKFLGQ